jgi:hypothetical protein
MDNPEKAAAAVDPTKHVNYTYGMVLGVDDFTQEFAYHAHRDRWAARDIVGYGTLAGLRVTAEKNKSGELEVVVSAGTAVSPRGQLIRVPAAQCVNVNQWLAGAENRAAVAELTGESPDAPLTLYVVLSYRERPTDKVPILGEPSRGDEESLASSRLKDDFLLELRLEAPPQTEEGAVRDFARRLFEHTEFTDEPGAFTELEDFLARLRRASGQVPAPPADPAPPPDTAPDSPPGVMRVEAARRGEYLRAAFRLWATELRPLWRPAHFGEACDCPAGAHVAAPVGGGDDRLLLAELSVPLTAGLQVDSAAGVAVSEGRRPYLLHQRMMQEWLLEAGCCARAGREGEAGDGLKKVLRSRGGVTLTLDDSGGREQVTLETAGGQMITLKDGPGAIEIADSNGNSIMLEASGVTVTTAAKVTVRAGAVEVSAGMVTVDAGVTRFSGLVQCDTLISNSVVSASYSPGAGNIW